jgi:hypothetical protein
MFSQVNPEWSRIVGIALLAMAFLPSHAWAEGFYADVHGGVPFFNNDSARVTALPTGVPFAHTPITRPVGSPALRPVMNGQQVSQVNLIHFSSQPP